MTDLKLTLLQKSYFCKVYLIIKQYIDLFLAQDNNDVCYSEFPYVDIFKVADGLGIAAIKYAPPGSLGPNEHAWLDKENAVIYVNKDDSEEEQRFSIAHELFHFLFFRTDLLLKDVKLNPSQIKIVKKLTVLNEPNKKRGNDKRKVEQIADHFAANLLVPIERFSLWEDKQNSEIAKAFGVTEKCIWKRRGEVENELDYMLS
jgi:hypothetical protein